MQRQTDGDFFSTKNYKNYYIRITTRIKKEQLVHTVANQNLMN